MDKSAVVLCPKCGAENEVPVQGESYAEQLELAHFVFGCRQCGTELPRPTAAELERTSSSGSSS